jgi:acetolactate synthase-1/2/3 large subunit
MAKSDTAKESWAGASPPDTSDSGLRPAVRRTRVCDRLLDDLAALGATHAFGILGGAVAPIYDAIVQSRLELVHCRHETGAAFAATEAHFASGRPGVLFTTAGPGLTNAVTGIAAARWEGAKLVVISGVTSARNRGRWAFQETTAATSPVVFAPGPLFHYAAVLEHPSELDVVAARLSTGLTRPGAFVAGIAIPMDVQLALLSTPSTVAPARPIAPLCDEATVAQCADWFAREPFAIWVGFGARHAAASIRALAESTGAPVICSPRAKGIFPEDHPLFAGVSGLGGRTDIAASLADAAIQRTLVLGTRLGEFTSFWNPELVPPQGFVHIDVDPDVFGASYPLAPTFGIQADVGSFVRALLGRLHVRARRPASLRARAPQPSRTEARAPVRPGVLMEAIQRCIVNETDALVMTEAGNAFAWGTQGLRFREPGRYRVSVGFGSMGHAAAGVVGAALARAGKAFAIVGDGAMLMLNEISTAVAHRAKAVWVVLNDGQYGMTQHGMLAVGFVPVGTTFPRVDFVAVARAIGADGVRVGDESELDAALAMAVDAPGPFVVDVLIDPAVPAPGGLRNESLLRQFARGDGDEGGAR